MERVVRRFRLYSPPVYTGVLTIAGVGYLLVHHLASITGGRLAESEAQALAAHPSWHSIWNGMLDAPYFAALRVVHYGSSTPFYNRLVAAGLGLAAAGLVYFALQRWVGWKLAALGTILFGSSGALLHTARLVNPQVMQLLAVAFLLAWYALSHREPQPKHLLAGVFVCLLLYTPGVLPLVVLAGWLNRQSLRASWLQANKRYRSFTIGSSAVLLAPLVYHLATHGFRTVLRWLGYGLQLNTSAAKDFVRGLWHVPIHLFIRGSSDGTFGMAHQALINAPVSCLAILGAYVTISRFRESRWRFLMLLLICCWLLAAMDGLAESVIAPIICILAAIGLAYLLSEWYRVFPRNPIARNAGMLLVVLLVALSSWYEIRSYFVAWPHSPATAAAFVCSPTALPAPDCNLIQ